jgi:hypothetical protein
MLPVKSGPILKIILTQPGESCFFNQFFSKEVRKSKKTDPRQKISIFKQEVVMKNKVILLTAMFLIGSLLTAQTSFSTSEYPFEQETYLFQKQPVEDAPWNIILPDEKQDPYAKLEYFNYPIDGEFYFDLKGYNIPVVESYDQFFDDIADGYALIYYVDPWESGIYVLGTTYEVWKSTAKNKSPRGIPPGHEGVNLKIDGSCGINEDDTKNLTNIPVSYDANHPNGGKVWLIPTKYINDPSACTWTEMIDWPNTEEDLMEFFFETSLITYGFIAEEEQD